MKSKFIIIALMSLMAILLSCTKLDFEPATKVETSYEHEMGANKVRVKGTVIELSSKNHSEMGFCYSDYNFEPTVSNTKVVVGTPKLGDFSAIIAGLTKYQQYHIRSYCKDGSAYIYGHTESFYMGELDVTTNSVSSISSTTAVSGGYITNTAVWDKPATITAVGVCWSTNINPTISLSTKTTHGSSSGSYTSNITGLSAGTTYHVRAYVTYSFDTEYGEDKTFTTLNILTITTNSISKIATTTATCGGNITLNGAVVTSRGVCWSTAPNPTVSLSTKTVDGSGAGSYTSNITGLLASTTYHVKAYATHSLGTEYGDDKTFTTSDGVNDLDGNTYNLVTIGSQVWMLENLKTTKYRDGSSITNVSDNTVWSNTTSGAYCWYNNNISNKSPYGALYNYYAVSDNRNLCPTGWHVPTDNDWNTLASYLGGESVLGGKLKESGTSHWTTPNTGATNSSGFTALPGGARYTSDGLFHDINNFGVWWTATNYDTVNAWLVWLSFDLNSAGKDWDTKNDGLSVRCIKD